MQSSSGSLKKINRYVYKALHSNPNGISLDEISYVVNCCNKNSNPVSKITDVISECLVYYESIGVVNRDENKYHLTPFYSDRGFDQVDHKPHKFDDQLYEECGKNIQPNSLSVDDVFSPPGMNYLENECNQANYASVSLSSIPSPGLKRKKHCKPDYSNEDDDEENVESHRKRRHIHTVLDERPNFKPGHLMEYNPEPQGFLSQLMFDKSLSEGEAGPSHRTSYHSVHLEQNGEHTSGEECISNKETHLDSEVDSDNQVSHQPVQVSHQATETTQSHLLEHHPEPDKVSDHQMLAKNSFEPVAGPSPKPSDTISPTQQDKITSSEEYIINGNLKLDGKIDSAVLHKPTKRKPSDLIEYKVKPKKFASKKASAYKLSKAKAGPSHKPTGTISPEHKRFLVNQNSKSKQLLSRRKSYFYLN